MGGLADVTYSEITGRRPRRAIDLENAIRSQKSVMTGDQPEDSTISDALGIAADIASALSPGAAGVKVAAAIGGMSPLQLIRKALYSGGRGIEVPKATLPDIRSALAEQGYDTSKQWIRGVARPRGIPSLDTPVYRRSVTDYRYSSAPTESPELNEYLLAHSDLPGLGQPSSIARSFKDRGVTKFNTKGGVWLTDSPNVANTYVGREGHMIPVYTKPPHATVDAKGGEWQDFYATDKDWLEAFGDPSIRSIRVDNVIDIGGHQLPTTPVGGLKSVSGDIVYDVADAEEEALRRAITANNLFVKKPFGEEVVSAIDGYLFPFAQGGRVC